MSFVSVMNGEEQKPQTQKPVEQASSQQQNPRPTAEKEIYQIRDWAMF